MFLLINLVWNFSTNTHRHVSVSTERSIPPWPLRCVSAIQNYCSVCTGFSFPACPFYLPSTTISLSSNPYECFSRFIIFHSLWDAFELLRTLGVNTALNQSWEHLGVCMQLKAMISTLPETVSRKQIGSRGRASEPFLHACLTMSTSFIVQTKGRHPQTLWAHDWHGWVLCREDILQPFTLSSSF